MNVSNDLSQYRRDVTSQWGEDGIIAEILRRIGTSCGICVEFGAWDGKHLSNTWDLWHNRGWNAILIEGDPAKFADLAASVSDNFLVTPYCAYVEAAGENSLDAILDRIGLTATLDLLSIDIDGDDGRVFGSMQRHLPRVLVIEYNPTIPPELDLVGVAGTRFGASASSLVTLASSKGYRLVACTITNLFFVRDEEFAALGIVEPTLAEIMPRDHITYVVTAYDGTPYLTRIPTYAPPLPAFDLGAVGAALLRRGAPATPAPDGCSLVPVKIFAAE